MIRFENLTYLNYLWVLPAIAGLFLLYLYWKRSTLKKYGDSVLISRLIPEISAFKGWFRFALILLALVFLIFGIANPQVGSKLEKEERSGIDIIIALDVSNSMLAEDIRPNRLERARLAISRFIDRLEGDRIGIIVFAGRAYPLLPLTADHAAAKMFLSKIDAGIVPVQGTSISDAIDLAMRSFPAGPQGKALIIISDGEDHEGGVIKKVEEARSKGIVVHTIGIGSPQGVPIPLYRNGVRVGFRTTSDGQTVITRLNESMLQQIASAGLGVYVRATNTQFGLNRIFDEMGGMQKAEFDGKVFAEFDSIFYYFLYFSLFLLILELLVFERSSRWYRKFNRYLPVVLLLFAGMNASAQSENSSLRKGNRAFNNDSFHEAELNYRRALEKKQNSARGNFNLGNSLFRQDNLEEAGQAFQRAIANETNPEILSKAFYNLGNSLLLNQQLPESIDAYRQALRLNPNDDDARYNLAFARQLLQQQEQQQQQQQDGDSGEDEDENQENAQQGDEQDDKDQDAKEQQQQETQQPQQISRQEAERMLEALKEEELKTLEKIKDQRFKDQRIKIERDW